MSATARKRRNPLRGRFSLYAVHAVNSWEPWLFVEQLIHGSMLLMERHGEAINAIVVHEKMHERLETARVGCDVYHMAVASAPQPVFAQAGAVDREVERINGIVLAGPGSFMVVFPDIADDPLGVLVSAPLLGRMGLGL